MMEGRYHVTTQTRFYPDMSNVNKNIAVETKLISPPTYFFFFKLEVLKMVINHTVIRVASCMLWAIVNSTY
jgi:hypothetical protein